MPTDVARRTDLTSTDKLVYARLMDMSKDRGGQCYPSQAKIAAEIGATRRTVIRSMQRLAEVGLIVEHKEVGERSSCTVVTCDEMSQGCDKDTPVPVTKSHRTCDKKSQHISELSSEPKAELKEQRADAPSKPKTRRAAKPAAEPVELPVGLDDPEFREAWGRWQTYRAERNKKLTRSTMLIHLNKLDEMGSEKAVASINQSIDRVWTGLFEPKDYVDPYADVKADIARERMNGSNGNGNGRHAPAPAAPVQASLPLRPAPKRVEYVENAAPKPSRDLYPKDCLPPEVVKVRIQEIRDVLKAPAQNQPPPKPKPDYVALKAEQDAALEELADMRRRRSAQ